MNTQLLLPILLLTNAFLFGACSIDQVFYHRGKITDNLSFYFSSEPLVNTLGERDTMGREGWKTMRLMMPKTSITSQCLSSAQQIVSNLKQVQNPRYKFSLEKVAKGKGPIDGMLLTISYDPRFVKLKISRGP